MNEKNNMSPLEMWKKDPDEDFILDCGDGSRIFVGVKKGNDDHWYIIHSIKDVDDKCDTVDPAAREYVNKHYTSVQWGTVEQFNRNKRGEFHHIREWPFPFTVHPCHPEKKLFRYSDAL